MLLLYYQKLSNFERQYIDDINEDLDRHQRNLRHTISLEEFGLFLGETMGKIGDRHASVRGYRTQDTLYLPLIFAPVKDKVLVLHRDGKTPVNRSKEKQKLLHFF